MSNQLLLGFFVAFQGDGSSESLVIDLTKDPVNYVLESANTIGPPVNMKAVTDVVNLSCSPSTVSFVSVHNGVLTLSVVPPVTAGQQGNIQGQLVF